ncbi:hypothetical protein B0M43_0022005 [Flavobacterium sp. KBS0721]|nr:hypothetical protein B0M43_0022005 [Flavobacterium sp. KBS0721]
MLQSIKSEAINLLQKFGLLLNRDLLIFFSNNKQIQILLTMKTNLEHEKSKMPLQIQFENPSF